MVTYQALLIFINVHVQIIKRDGFQIDGLIKEVYDDSILFQTAGKLRIIDFTEIAEVREWRRRP